MSLIKGMRITARSAPPSRAEAFNVFNNVNFYNPGHVQTDRQFGQITAARDPRAFSSLR